jgi:Flp pilus assembly protein TadD
MTGAWVERFYQVTDRRAFLVKRAPNSFSRSLGRSAVDRQQWNVAVPALTRAISEHDTLLERSLLGMALIKSGQPAEAVPYLSELVTFEPHGLRQVRYNLALALLLSGHPRDAVTLYERLVREDPRDVDSLYNLGVAYRQAGQLAEARRAFRGSLGLNPGHAGAQANLRELGEK